MLKKREEIKELLNKDLDVDTFRNELSKLNTIENAKLGRIIQVDNFDLEEGQIITEVGSSWTNINSDHNEGFIIENEKEIEVYFTVENGKGYELQYFSEYIMDEEIAYDIQDNDELYQELMSKLGSGHEMYKEAEVIVDNNTKYRIVSICDERDEVGNITVELEIV